MAGGAGARAPELLLEVSPPAFVQVLVAFPDADVVWNVTVFFMLDCCYSYLHLDLILSISSHAFALVFV